MQKGKRIRAAHLEVRVLASPLPQSRVGIIVPRHRRSAVERNRLKRRLRELVRIEVLGVLRKRPPIDVTIRATPAAYAAPLPTLRQDVASITERLRSDPLD
jgi:ribonuclease P protein component